MTHEDLLVVDASVAVKWVIPEEEDDLAEALYFDSRRAGASLLAPPIFHSEVVNAILRKVRRRLITQDEGWDAVSLFQRFHVATLAPDQLIGNAFKLAILLKLGTIHDLLYVVLAQSMGCTLWTADKRLANAVALLPVSVRLLSTYRPAAS